MSERSAIYISEQDFDRLSLILEKQTHISPTIDGLLQELDRASLVHRDQLPIGTVAMNSLVHFMNEDSGAEYQLKLVYPGQNDEGEECVSVFAPAGAALLGLTVGDRIDWPVEGNKRLKLKIIHVHQNT